MASQLVPGSDGAGRKHHGVGVRGDGSHEFQKLGPWDPGTSTTMINPRVIIWLVVWNIFFSPYIGLLIIPIDFHIFQRGANHQPVIDCISTYSYSISTYSICTQVDMDAL